MEHICKQLPNYLKEDSLSAVTMYKENGRWYFCYKRYSGEQEVKMGEASHVGELDQSIDFTINYCPFCGEKLL